MNKDKEIKRLTKGLSREGKALVTEKLSQVDESDSVSITDEFIEKLGPKDAKVFLKNVTKSQGPIFVINPDAPPEIMEHAKWLVSTNEGHAELGRIIITHGLLILRKIHISFSNGSSTPEEIIKNSDLMIRKLSDTTGLQFNDLKRHIVGFINANLVKLMKNPEEFMMHANAFLKNQPEAN